MNVCAVGSADRKKSATDRSMLLFNELTFTPLRSPQFKVLGSNLRAQIAEVTPKLFPISFLEDFQIEMDLFS